MITRSGAKTVLDVEGRLLKRNKDRHCVRVAALLSNAVDLARDAVYSTVSELVEYRRYLTES